MPSFCFSWVKCIQLHFKSILLFTSCFYSIHFSFIWLSIHNIFVAFDTKTSFFFFFLLIWRLVAFELSFFIYITTSIQINIMIQNFERLRKSKWIKSFQKVCSHLVPHLISKFANKISSLNWKHIIKEHFKIEKKSQNEQSPFVLILSVLNLERSSILCNKKRIENISTNNSVDLNWKC